MTINSLNRYNNGVNIIPKYEFNSKNKIYCLRSKDKIKSIRNCELKKNATNLVFSDGKCGS